MNIDNLSLEELADLYFQVSAELNKHISLSVEEHNNGNFTILGCELVQTCGACPEQYDVFLHDNQIGYLRLRHGSFTADYPDAGGSLVYSASPNGDGIFEDAEREFYITQAVMAILNAHKSHLDMFPED